MRKRAVLESLAAASINLAGCHNVPRDINAEEVVSDFATPVFSHKITIKKLRAVGHCEVEEEIKKDER